MTSRVALREDLSWLWLRRLQAVAFPRGKGARCDELFLDSGISFLHVTLPSLDVLLMLYRKHPEVLKELFFLPMR